MDKGDRLYYAEIVKSCGVFDVHDISIRTVEDTYFVGTDIDTHRAYIFTYDQLETCLFNIRMDAVNYAKEIQNQCGVVKLHKIKEEED